MPSGIYCINDVSIYIPAIKKKISSELIADCTMEEIRNTYVLAQKAQGYINRYNDILFFFSPESFKVDVDEIRLPYFISAIELSKEELQKVLSTFSEAYSSKALLIFGDSGFSISNGFSEEELQVVIGYLYSKEKTRVTLEENSCIITLAGDEFVLQHNTTGQNEISLILCIPSKNLFSPLQNYRAWTWIISVITLLITIFFAVWIRNIITNPMHKLINAFKIMQTGDFSFEATYEKNDEFLMLYDGYNEMRLRLRNLIEQVYEQKILTQKQELKMLQYQINPHFIYNTLYGIYRIAKVEDYDTIVKLSKHLMSYYRYIAKGMEDEVYLKEEINHARDFSEVQSIRYSGRIQSAFEEIPEEYKNYLVPRLIVQPLIENSIKHALITKAGIAVLQVGFEIQDKYLVISVDDNGDSLEDDVLGELQTALESERPFHEGTGLLNVHRRLIIRYGHGSGLKLSRSKLGGLRVEIRLRLEEENRCV
jgi:two-component system sensor histidine kinase YesM